MNAAMKNILMRTLMTMASIIFLSSCLTSYPECRQYVGLINYSEFDRQGLFATESNSVNFDYIPIGSLIIEDVGGMDSRTNKVDTSSGNADELYSGTKRKGHYVAPSTNRAVELAIKALKNIGAKGIINMKIQFSMEYVPLEQVSVEKITLTGMAIK